MYIPIHMWQNIIDSVKIMITSSLIFPINIYMSVGKYLSTDNTCITNQFKLLQSPRVV